jgi:hypothetical protein
VIRKETATILPFRDGALRRPIDLVQWTNSHAPAAEPVALGDNVIPLIRLNHPSRLRTRRFLRGGPSGGEAA